MKKIICLLLTLMMAASVTAASSEAQPEANLFTPGTYEASEQGLLSEIKVQVTVNENEITNVLIDASGETPELGGAAAGKLAEAILNAQTPNVDTLSGATVSSDAIIKAATAALTEAGADIAVLDANRRDQGDGAEKVKEDKTVDTEIVIIGAGGAGMTAAIMAQQAGRDFVILEKMPYVGGNTTKATGGMNAAETHYQKEQGIRDSKALFAADTMKGGHALNDPKLVAMLANCSADAIDWLDSIGADLPKISFSGGASVNRIHAPADGSGVGSYLVDRFSAKLAELGVEVLLETEATELLTDAEGKITGVKAVSPDANYTFNCKAVILASGGFGANEEMYTQYRPDLKGTVTTNAPGATGDGIIMAQKLGADLVDIEQIQLHPTVEQTTSMLITESVRGDGAILVNQQGERFVNELLTRDAVSAAELAQEGHYAYIIFDQQLRDGLKAIEKYVKANLTVQADTIEGLAEQLGIEPATLAKTLSDWNEIVKNQRDTQFGRTTGMNADLSTAPYYAIKIAPGIHHTMGGIKIDTAAQVINTDGKPIPGLFAAGEVTGGVHGGNRLGGNAVADIVIFGRIAAQSAIDYIAPANTAEPKAATAEAAVTEEKAPAESKAGFTPGTYTGSGRGYSENAPVKVKITVDEAAITAAEISGAEEIPFGQAYFETYEKALIGRTDGEIDAMAQATMTRNGVAEAVGRALATARGEMPPEPVFNPGTYEGSGMGYSEKAPVNVRITVDEYAITAAEITGAEEIPFGQAYFETYEKALIGRTDGEIDAMAQATMTRNGVAEAVGKALAVARGEMKQEDAVILPAAEETEAEAAAEEPAEAEHPTETAEAGTKFIPGIYEGSGQGYGANIPVTVKITVDESSITAAEIAGDEEQPFGVPQFETYAAALIGRADGEIDAITGATMTRNGITEAVSQALDQARSGQAAAAMETEAETKPAAGITFTSGTYTAIDSGFGGPMTVKVVFSESGIESIEIVSSSETPEIGGAAMDTLIPIITEANGTGVDGVSGATFSSNGLKNAVNAAAEHANCSDLAAFQSAK